MAAAASSTSTCCSGSAGHSDATSSLSTLLAPVAVSVHSIAACAALAGATQSLVRIHQPEAGTALDATLDRPRLVPPASYQRMPRTAVQPPAVT